MDAEGSRRWAPLAVYDADKVGDGYKPKVESRMRKTLFWFNERAELEGLFEGS